MVGDEVLVNGKSLANTYINVLNNMRTSGEYVRVILKPGEELSKTEDDVMIKTYINNGKSELDDVLNYLNNMKEPQHNEIKTKFDGNSAFYSIFCAILFDEVPNIHATEDITPFNTILYKIDVTRFFLMLNNHVNNIDESDIIMFRRIIRPVVIALFKKILVGVMKNDAIMQKFKLNHQSMLNMFNEQTSIFRELFKPSGDGEIQIRHLQQFVEHSNNEMPQFDTILPIYKKVRLEKIEVNETKYSEDVVMRFSTYFKYFPRSSSFLLSSDYINANPKSPMVGTYYDMLVKQNVQFNNDRFVSLEYFKYWIIIMNAKNSGTPVPIVLQKSEFIKKHYPNYYAAEHFYLDMLDSSDVDVKYKYFASVGLPLFFLDESQITVLGDLVNNKTWRWTVDILHHEPDKPSFYDGWANYHLRYDKNYKQYITGAIEAATSEDLKNHLVKQKDFTYEKWASQQSNIESTKLEQKFLTEVLTEAYDNDDEEEEENPSKKNKNAPKKDTGVNYSPMFSSLSRMFSLWADTVLDYVQNNPLQIAETVKDVEVIREFRIITQHAEFVDVVKAYVGSSVETQFFKYLSAYYPGFLFCYYNDFERSIEKKNFFFDVISTFTETRFPYFLEIVEKIQNLDQSVQGNEEVAIQQINVEEKEIDENIMYLTVELEHTRDELSKETQLRQDDNELTEKIKKIKKDIKELEDEIVLKRKERGQFRIHNIILKWLNRMHAYLYTSSRYHFRFKYREPLLIFSVVNQYIVERKKDDDGKDESFTDFLIRNSMQLWYNATMINTFSDRAFNYPYKEFNPAPYLDWIMWSFGQKRYVLPMLTYYNTTVIGSNFALEIKEKGKDVIVDFDIIRNVITEATAKASLKAPADYYRHVPPEFKYKISFPLVLLLLQKIDDIPLTEEFTEEKRENLKNLKIILFKNIKGEEELSFITQNFIEKLQSVQRNTAYIGGKTVYGTKRVLDKQISIFNDINHNILAPELLAVAQQKQYDLMEMKGLNNSFVFFVNNIAQINKLYVHINSLYIRYANSINIDVSNGVNVDSGYKVFFIDALLQFLYIIDSWMTQLKAAQKAAQLKNANNNDIIIIQNAKERVERVRFIIYFISYRFIRRELDLTKADTTIPIESTNAYKVLKKIFEEDYEGVDIEFQEEKEKNWTGIRKYTYKQYKNAQFLLLILKGVKYMYAEDLFENFFDKFEFTDRHMQNFAVTYTEDRKIKKRFKNNVNLPPINVENWPPLLYNPTTTPLPEVPLFEDFNKMINSFRPPSDHDRSTNSEEETIEELKTSPESAMSEHSRLTDSKEKMVVELTDSKKSSEKTLDENTYSEADIPIAFVEIQPVGGIPETVIDINGMDVDKSERAERSSSSERSEDVDKTKNTKPTEKEIEVIIISDTSDTEMSDSEVSAEKKREMNRHFKERERKKAKEEREKNPSIVQNLELPLPSVVKIEKNNEETEENNDENVIVLPGQQNLPSSRFKRPRPTALPIYIDDNTKKTKISSILRAQYNVRLLECNKENPPKLIIAAYHPQWYDNMSPATKKVFHENPTVPIVLVSEFPVSAPLHKDLVTYRIPEVWVC